MRIGRGDIRRFWNVNSFTPIRAKLGSRPILHLYVAQTVNRSTLNPLHSCTILSLVYVDCLLLESNIYCNSKNMVPNGNWNLFWMWCSLQFIGIDFCFQSYFIHTRICPVDIPPKCHTNLFATADFVDPHTEYVLLICINMKLLQHKFDFEIRRIDVKNKIQIWSQYLCSFFLFLWRTTDDG